MGTPASRVLEPGAQPVTLVTTGRVDAVLHEPPPARISHTMSRPRVVGTHVPALEHVFQDPDTVWQKRTLDWSGDGERTLEMCIGTALWDRSGSDPLPLRWVLTRDPEGTRSPFPLTPPTDPAVV